MFLLFFSWIIFSIPYFELRFPEVSLQKRNYPIQYVTSRQETDQLAIKIPEGYSVKYLPPALRVQSPYVEFEIIYDQQGDEIDITRKLAFPRRYIPVEDYESYKSDLEKIAYSSKQKIFLEQKQISKTNKTDENSVSENEIKETDTAIPNTDTNSSDTANLENVEGAKKWKNFY